MDLASFRAVNNAWLKPGAGSQKTSEILSDRMSPWDNLLTCPDRGSAIYTPQRRPSLPPQESTMDMIRIDGGKRLQGTVPVAGAKNAALPILMATLVAPGEHRLANVPELVDVSTTLSLLGRLGCPSLLAKAPVSGIVSRPHPSGPTLPIGHQLLPASPPLPTAPRLKTADERQEYKEDEDRCGNQEYHLAYPLGVARIRSQLTLASATRAVDQLSRRRVSVGPASRIFRPP